MKKLITMTLVVLGVLATFSVAAIPVAASNDPAPAIGTPTIEKITPGYRRIEIWKIDSRYKYKVANKHAKTYRISGTKKQTKLKVNHYLKNYKKATWTRKKITQIKHNGKWMMYYYITTKKHHAGGWVKLTDVRVVSPRPSKAHGHNMADFDTWYRGLSQAGRNWYRGFAQAGGAADLDVNGEQVPTQF
ncbi:hypothetical protein [Lactiplantibacillus songbeiensis]|uniref:Extracellular protein n=1 Tax=Lactiplantibacillus songbeiensis TaxID=2559920 RepID=A0ABW4C1H0_9LACO|nr:hypothetical protein [Lactiplantibacillus songbeiensis]